MSDMHGGRYEKPNITCSVCGKAGKRFSLVLGKYKCDTCIINNNKPNRKIQSFVWGTK